MPHTPTARAIAALLAFISWSILALQLYLSIKVGIAQGISFPQLVINYFSFFTILINLLVAAVFTSTALTVTGPSSSLQTATAVYIAVVGLGYSLLLCHIWSPQGLQKLADVLLHDAIPLLYILFWLIFCRKQKPLSWSSPFVWLIWPAIYLTYSMIRGSITAWYPYHFLDPARAGYTPVISVIVGFLIAFLTIGFIAIALTRRNSADTLQR